MPPISRRTLLQAGAVAAVTGAVWTLGDSRAAVAADPRTETAPARALDRIGFGDAASESAHAFRSTLCDSAAAAL
ncbi:MAG: hypothetical protein JST33_14740, partial [Actinobacteria bacterium]|nr:hypothetical protein [Actinomycetota bacterium]